MSTKFEQEQKKAFKKFNIKEVREPISDHQNYINFDHAIYDDVNRMVEEFEDKWFLYNFFLEKEQEKLGVHGKEYEAWVDLCKWQKEEKLVTAIALRFKQLHKIESQDENMKSHYEQFFKYEIQQEFPQLEDKHIACFGGVPFLSNHEIQNKINVLRPYYIKYVQNSFAQYIYDKYQPTEERPVEMTLKSDAYIIFDRVEEIKNSFLNMHFNFEPDEYDIVVQVGQKEKSVKKSTCEILEKHYGLLYNPKNGIHYISDGQGKYIKFHPENNKYLYKQLRDQFYAITYDKEKQRIRRPIIWTKHGFYKIADEFSVVECEPEYNIIGFKNCCFDFKNRIIYKLDPNFPRLPFKNAGINFVYYKDLTDMDNPLKTIFNECFDQETREIIYKYFGRALFEPGYEETQDILFLLGKGGTGKTTFMDSLSKIFNNSKVVSADKFNPDNKFAFSTLLGADFLIMDEITNAKKGFTEKFKEMSGGASSIEVEKKGQDSINMPSSLMPRMVCIGNNFDKPIYKKFAGQGVVRRFCIIYLKRSILEAKKMTTEIDGTTYPITKDGHVLIDTYEKDGETYGTMCNFVDGKLNKIFDDQGKKMNGVQGRTSYHIDELTQQGCLEWFLQQIIIHYDHKLTSLLESDVARERAVMAYAPERWLAHKWIEPIYDDEGNLDKSEFILGSDLINFFKDEIDKHMLESTITNVYDTNLEKALYHGCQIDSNRHTLSDSDAKNYPGEILFRGLKFRDKPKPIEDISKIE